MDLDSRVVLDRTRWDRDVDRPREGRVQAEELPRDQVRGHRVLPAGQAPSQDPCFPIDGWVSKGVDPSVNSVEPPGLDGTRDRVGAEPSQVQLLHGDDVVLPRGENRDAGPGLSRCHAPSLQEKSLRVGGRL